MKWHWNWTMLNLCGIVAAILKMATGRNFSMSGINSGHHYLPTYQILTISGNVEFWQPFWKWQTSTKFWKRRIAPLMVTYHYVKFYVSIIIHLEVLNINGNIFYDNELISNRFAVFITCTHILTYLWNRLLIDFYWCVYDRVCKEPRVLFNICVSEQKLIFFV